MKKYICKFLLFLLKKLGKLIPYFKRKYMALYKDSILNAINDHIRGLFTNEYSLFVIQDGITTISNFNHHKIQYIVEYDRSFRFSIFLIYQNGVVKKTLSVEECEDSTPIDMFFNHFKSDAYELNDLFIALNDAI